MPAKTDIPDQGYLDLHCHLLPGVDDGCRDFEASLECIRLWQAAGFSGAVCTPHMATDSYPAILPERVTGWVEFLRQKLLAAQIDFRLWAGGEVRLGPDLIAWFRHNGVPTLGPGRCVLVDWWGDDWPTHCIKTCEYLLTNGYQPVLAHPERMGLTEQELSLAVDQLEHCGAWLQGNLNSISGGEGEKPQRRAEEYLSGGRYKTMATDTHNPITTPSRISGLAAIEKHVGREARDLLLHANTREILMHGVPKVLPEDSAVNSSV